MVSFVADHTFPKSSRSNSRVVQFRRWRVRGGWFVEGVAHNGWKMRHSSRSVELILLALQAHWRLRIHFEAAENLHGLGPLWQNARRATNRAARARVAQG